jgi:hypothetical protein
VAVRVINIRGLRTDRERAEVVYVGRRWAGVRRGGSRHETRPVVWHAHPLANPFRLSKVADAAERAACLESYRTWLLARPTLDADLAALWKQTQGGRLPLGCWCHPRPCHADVLAELLNARFGA